MLVGLAFLKVVWLWEFWFGSLAFFASISLFWQLNFRFGSNQKTGIICPPGSIHY